VPAPVQASQEAAAKAASTEKPKAKW
jgi:hypothetical protein